MPNPTRRYRPVVLAILDGFGDNPHTDHNAVLQAKTPTLDRLRMQFPHGLLNASELHVGLPPGQMGNSEVGHMNIGSGRIVMQDLPRIDQAIASGWLEKNPALAEFASALKTSGGACHLLGLLSPGGVHSHQSHLAALVRLLNGQNIPVHIHAFLDGRDTPPKSALDYLAEFRREVPDANFATVSGRYYAMDRDQRWERVELAYRALAEAQAPHYANVEEAVKAAYHNGKSDEFVLPAVVRDDYLGMLPKDGILMANFRADRAREILEALLVPDFQPFARPGWQGFAAALGLTEYSASLAKHAHALFAPASPTSILGEILSANGRTQLRIAETEKYAHVTFFFNGGREEPFPGESRILVPSPKVATYDLQPEMSAFEVTDRLVEAIASDQFDFIVVNYANCDMVGHTGNLAAAVAAVETVDQCLGRVSGAVFKEGGALVVTADHGNAEQMHDITTEQAHTAHTLNLVPVIFAASGLSDRPITLPQGEGCLADIAPSVLKLLDLPQPTEMTGRSLI